MLPKVVVTPASDRARPFRHPGARGSVGFADPGRAGNPSAK
jgi:hypothetical protein